jgi:hypothetical protein
MSCGNKLESLRAGTKSFITKLSKNCGKRMTRKMASPAVHQRNECQASQPEYVLNRPCRRPRKYPRET